MPDYRSMYFELFAAMAEAVEKLEAQQPETAKAILIEAQRQAEEEYLSAED